MQFVRSPAVHWTGYVEIARPDHWIKNIFVLPGIAVVLSLDAGSFHRLSLAVLARGFAAICLITSSNYVLNEILDGPSDFHHPFKRNRPVPSGRVRPTLAFIEWLLLMVAAVALAVSVSRAFTLPVAGLWLAGCLYNVPPIRAKDLPYIDVLSEAINNPLRMLAGWYLTGTSAVPVTSLLISYWMAGGYFMAIKRYSEFRELQPAVLSAYRKSFRAYTERGLLASIMFYACFAMLFFGGYTARYRLELVLSFPLIAAVMAVYLWLAFRPDSPVQHPEHLYREPFFLMLITLCTLVILIMLFLDLPWLYQVFQPTRVDR